MDLRQQGLFMCIISFPCPRLGSSMKSIPLETCFRFVRIVIRSFMQQSQYALLSSSHRCSAAANKGVQARQTAGARHERTLFAAPGEAEHRRQEPGYHGAAQPESLALGTGLPPVPHRHRSLVRGCGVA